MAYSKENPSSRQQKVSNLICAELAKVLRHGKRLDIRLLENEVTITKVKISPDLKIADCYFMPFLKSKLSVDEFLEAFESSKHSLRKQVTEAINLKYSPELNFFYDRSVENAMEVDKVLKSLKQ